MTRFAFVGDIALFGKFSTENPDIFHYLKPIRDFLAQFDHVIGNLETPLCDGRDRIRGKSAYIHGIPEDIAILTYLGIDIVNLANNHIFDFGRRGLDLTLSALDAAGIRHFGLNDKPVFLSETGGSFAFHGYCSFNTNPTGVFRGKGTGITPLNVRAVAKNLNRYRQEGHYNIVSVHSGDEHVNFPSNDDIGMARMFTNLASLVYYGHHPHVIQGVETINRSVIAYSLGNCLFDDVFSEKSNEALVRQSENNKTGMILEVNFENNEVSGSELHLTYLDEEQIRVGFEDKHDRIGFYSSALSEDPVEYGNRRQELLVDHHNRRRKHRNIGWYLKRLNLNTIQMLLMAKRNRVYYHIAMRTDV